MAASVADSSLDSSSKMSDFNSEDVNKLPEDAEIQHSNIKENEETSTNVDENFPESDEKSASEDNEWMDITGSGDFKKKVIKPGLGVSTRPVRGDMVTVSIAFHQDGDTFDENENLQFIVGDLDVIPALDLVASLMEKGEVAKVLIPSKLAYGKLGRAPDIPPDCDLECDIELKEVEKIDIDSLTVPRRLQFGDSKRAKGNFFYERGEYIDAIHCYERAAEYLDAAKDCSDNSAETLQELVDMRLKVYNNLAAAHLKLNAYDAALRSVESVLKIQPNNVKALFRKGKILGSKGSVDEAISCMSSAANLDPETKVIQAELAKLKSQRKKEEEAQKAMYKRMFKSEPKQSRSVSWIKKWSVISCGVVAVAVGSALAYRQFHM